MFEYQSQDVTALAKVLLSVQKQLQPALKDAENPFTKSSYASLNSVMETCREALHSSGIWMTQLPMPTPAHVGEGHVGLMTKLVDTKSGQWQSSFMVVPLPKNDPQGLGSAITYARRYALCAMLGIITEDDDGNAASLPAKKPRATQQPKATQSNTQQSQAQKQATPDNLPHIDGVNYQQVTASDGRACIVATGNTQAKKELLKGAGFQWNSQRRAWWKYAETA